MGKNLNHKMAYLCGLFLKLPNKTETLMTRMCFGLFAMPFSCIYRVNTLT